MNETMDFLLFCEYDANPASLVSVKWRNNGQVIRVDKDERLEGGNAEQTALLVKNASRHDIGEYTCELANAIGNDTSDTGVTVNVLCEYIYSSKFYYFGCVALYPSGYNHTQCLAGLFCIRKRRIPVQIRAIDEDVHDNRSDDNGECLHCP